MENRNTEVHDGGFELVKRARESVSSRPKPCASLKKPHETCLFAASCRPLPCRKKTDRGKSSAFPSVTSRFAPLILAHRGSILPWLIDDRAALRARRMWRVPTRLSATSLSAIRVFLSSRVPPPREVHQVGARKMRAAGNTIINQPYRCRVSADRLSREDNQLATFLEGKPGPTPAGKTLPHHYPETRFRICACSASIFSREICMIITYTRAWINQVWKTCSR